MTDREMLLDLLLAGVGRRAELLATPTNWSVVLDMAQKWL